MPFFQVFSIYNMARLSLQILPLKHNSFYVNPHLIFIAPITAFLSLHEEEGTLLHDKIGKGEY